MDKKEIGFVDDGLLYSSLGKYSGGVYRTESSLKIYKDYFDISYIPNSKFIVESIRTESERELALKKLEIIQKSGIKVDEIIFDIFKDYNLSKYARFENYITLRSVMKILKIYKSNFNLKFLYSYEPCLDLPLIGSNYGLIIKGYIGSLDYKFDEYLKRIRLNASGKYDLIYGIFEYRYYTNVLSFMKKYKPLFIAGNSKASYPSKLACLNIPFYKLNPGSSIDKNTLNYKTAAKSNYAIYFARLSPEKGIYEILKVAKEMDNIPIYILGEFESNHIKDKFLKMVNKYHLTNIHYLGFQSGEEKWKLVSRARVLLYPSHSDTFSLVVLEALALGVPVVSYRIKAIDETYKFEQVMKVDEFDISEMARIARKIYNLSDTEIENFMNDNFLLEFIRKHTNWYDVAIEEIKLIEKVLSNFEK